MGSIIEHDNKNFYTATGFAFGCSFTSGTGVDSTEAWPSLLNVDNIGQPGASNDYICRTAIDYIQEYKPKYIFVMWTFPARREWIDEDGNKLRFKPDDVKFKWEEAHLELQNSEYDKYNKGKNKLLLELYCLNNNVRLYQMNIDDIDHTLMRRGSDNSHPGREWHTNVAEHFTKQMVAHSPEIPR
jgi:hypothetical protein